MEQFEAEVASAEVLENAPPATSEMPGSGSGDGRVQTRRGFFRSEVDLAASLSIEGEKGLLPVVIRNLSATGAALTTTSLDSLPDKGLWLIVDIPT